MNANVKPLVGSILLLFAGAAVAGQLKAPVNLAASSTAKMTTAPKVSLSRPGINAARGTAALARIETASTSANKAGNASAPSLQNGATPFAPSAGKLPLGPLGSDKAATASSATNPTQPGVALPGQAPSTGANNGLGNTLGLPSAFRDPRGDPSKKRSNKVGQQSSGTWSGSDLMVDKTDSKGNQDIVRVEHYDDDDHSMTVTSTVKDGKETQDIVYVDKKTGEKTTEKSETPADKPKDPTPPEKPKDPPPQPPEEPELADGQKTPLPDGVEGGHGSNRGSMDVVTQGNGGNSLSQSMSQPGHPDAGVRTYNLSGLSKAQQDPKAGLAPWIMPAQDAAGGASSPIPVPTGPGPMHVDLGASLKDPGPLGGFQGGFGGPAAWGTAPR